MLLLPSILLSQEDFKYRRSSLHLVLIETESFPKKEIVMGAWNNYPFPDKYNDHRIEIKNMNPNNYVIEPPKKETNKVKKEEKKTRFGGLSKTISKASEAASETINSASDAKAEMEWEAKKLSGEITKMQIDSFLIDSKLANKIVAKWFNENNGLFNMELIQERGFYNASEMEASIAKGQARGLASLGDAGEELIKNTFVVFSKPIFIENEPVARAAKVIADIKANEISNSLLRNEALKTSEKAYEKAKEGYSVWTRTWLYQLEWNETVASTFYSEHWNNYSEFVNSNNYKLKYVGSELSTSLVVFSLNEKRTEADIIKLATVRNLDKVFAKLQKEYDVFKPMVPIISIDPIKAHIGMKEGIEGGEKFDILEMVYDEQEGITTYKKVSTVKVEKDKVWDNRFNAGQKVNPEDEEPESNLDLRATEFEKNRKAGVGMLLKQRK